VKGVGSNASCSFCGQGFEYENGVLFACGHIYHTKHSSTKSNEPICEICSANDGVIGKSNITNFLILLLATKIFEAKLKKLSNQPQHRYEVKKISFKRCLKI